MVIDVPRYIHSDMSGYQREVISEIYDRAAEYIEQQYKHTPHRLRKYAIDYTLIDFHGYVLEGRLTFYRPERDAEKLMAWLRGRVDANVAEGWDFLAEIERIKRWKRIRAWLGMLFTPVSFSSVAPRRRSGRKPPGW